MVTDGEGEGGAQNENETTTTTTTTTTDEGNQQEGGDPQQQEQQDEGGDNNEGNDQLEEDEEDASDNTATAAMVDPEEQLRRQQKEREVAEFLEDISPDEEANYDLPLEEEEQAINEYKALILSRSGWEVNFYSNEEHNLPTILELILQVFLCCNQRPDETENYLLESSNPKVYC